MIPTVTEPIEATVQDKVKRLSPMRLSLLASLVKKKNRPPQVSSASLEEKVEDLSAERLQLLVHLLQKKQGLSPAPPSQEPLLPPALTPDPANRNEPFPLTDLQEGYYIGRSVAFNGKTASHCYVEIEKAGLDVGRMEDALNDLIRRHDMLRAHMLEDGRQRILPEAPRYEIRVQDLREVPEAEASPRLEAVRHRLSHNVLPAEQWPLFEIQASLLPGGRVRLHVSLDGLVFDGWSISLFLKEWAARYQDPERPEEPLELSFRDYVLAEKAIEKTPEFQRAKAYWAEKVKSLAAAPQLPLAKDPSDLTEGRFVRRRRVLEPEKWQRILQRAARRGLTPTGVLSSAYAEVLSLWSKERRFTLNIPSFNRLPLHPQVKQLIGEFASFTLLDIDNTGEESFEARAKKHQQCMWADLDHRQFNGVRLMRELAQAHNRPSGVPMPIVFTASPQNEAGEDEYPTLAAEEWGDVVFAVNQTTQVWLDNHVSQQKGALVCDWDSVDELFPEGLSQTLLDAYFRLLNRLADDEAFWSASASDVADFLLPEEQVQTRLSVNGRPAPIPEIRAQDLFLEQVRNRPRECAVMTNRRTLTYEELGRLANQWGRKLRAQGGPDQPIAVVMEKGWEQAAAVLGILQSGAPYLPVDALTPKERLWSILEDSGARIVLTQSWLEESIEWPENVVRFRVDQENPDEWDGAPLEPVQTPDDLAYIIYTSGSTGKPKGVMVRHRGLVNSLVQTIERFEIGPQDRVLAVTALHHDMSAFDLFGVLGAGGVCIIPDASGRRDPAHWSEWMRRENVTVWNSVPPMMEMLLEYAEGQPGAIPSTLRLAFLGGDWISVSLPERLRRQAEGARVVSVGGPTETTLWNIWYPVDAKEAPGASIPYGFPIANTEYYVLNENSQPCPDWVPGELCCAGVGLAKGYWKDEAKTAEKFIEHPRLGKRIYRTGDWGCYRPDGALLFLGRKDLQVKLQGQRIELGEIEAALKQHPNIRHAVATVKGAAGGRKFLAAYYQTEDNTELAPETLRSFLQTKLPEYMMPAAYVRLDVLPLTGNGKVNREALPDPAPEKKEVGATPRESSEILAKVTAIVRRVLQTETVDPQVNLLALGASSIDMVRIGNELSKEFGSRLKMEEIFRLQSVKAIADHFGSHTELERPSSINNLMGGDSPLLKKLASYTVLIEPCKRAEFKNSRPGIRRDLEGKLSLPLTEPENREELERQFWLRRSHRQFSLKPIPFESFSRFLACMMEITVHGRPKTLYGTPGGLNPTQVYLHVKKGRITGVPQGTYYYHPAEHRLVQMKANAELDRNIHTPFVNQPIFDQAAFSIFLIARLDAIGPSYGQPTLHYIALEAGIMSQLLEMWAPPYSIGLCQIGYVELEEARTKELFDLDDNHVLVHSLLGGYVSREEIESPPPAETANPCAAGSEIPDKMADMIRRIKDLSPDEVRGLLASHKEGTTNGKDVG